jgi:hypothetical protein
MTYDPHDPPPFGEWLQLDEQEQADLVAAYHAETEDEAENPTLHAMIHVVVENQLASGDERVTATLDRLTREGLDRHDAVHAIGSVLVNQIWRAGHAGHEGEVSPGDYYDELARLTARSWRAQA